MKTLHLYSSLRSLHKDVFPSLILCNFSKGDALSIFFRSGATQEAVPARGATARAWHVMTVISAHVVTSVAGTYARARPSLVTQCVSQAVMVTVAV